MRFKVAFCTKKLNPKGNLEGYYNYEFIDGYHCFLSKKSSNLKLRGVHITEDDSLKDATNFISDYGADSMCSLQFVFINTKSDKIYYYNFTPKQLFAFLEKLFIIKKEGVSFEVDLERLQYVSKIKISIDHPNQITLFDNIKDDSIDRLAADISTSGTPKKVEHIYEYTTGTVFNRKTVDNLKDKSKNHRISINGIDRDGNYISYYDYSILEFRININDSTIEELARVPYEIFIGEFNAKGDF